MSHESASEMSERLVGIIDYLMSNFPEAATPEVLWPRLCGALREAVPLNPPPDWTDSLDGVLIDWHQLLFEDCGRFHEVFNQRGRYSFQARYAELDKVQLTDQLSTGSEWLAHTRLLAQVLCAALQAKQYLLRLDPNWFVLYAGRIDADWVLLATAMRTPHDRLLKHYDIGWMHPALRKREIPPDLSAAAAVTHAYAYLILHALTRLPPASNQASFQNQIERFRAYNPRLPPDLRDWLRRFLRLPPESQTTPLDCWEALNACLQSRERFCPATTATHDVAGDSVYGRNKRNNQNEDVFFSLTVPGVALLGLADGVSTASIGAGGLASFTVREVSIRQRDALLAQLLALSADEDWEEAGWALIEAFFETCHQAVVDKINDFLSPGELQQSPVEGTMSSTLILALVRGNQVLIGHWGDSRAYRLSARGAIRLTEDHNRDLEALVAAAKNGTPYERPEQGAALVKVLGQCQYDPAVARCKPVRQKVSRDAGILAADEWLLLCSDGLLSGLAEETEADKEARLAAIAGRFPKVTCRELARQLVRSADDERGDDNITALLLRASVAGTSADAQPNGQSSAEAFGSNLPIQA